MLENHGNPLDDHSKPLIVKENASEAFAVLPGRLRQGLLLLCDHASNEVPPEYASLGMPAAELERHIAYDIGAAGVTRALSAKLGVPAVLTRYSRLLIDCNRGADDPTLVLRLSDGAVIPGNRDIDAAERDTRIARFYAPYHAAITGLIDQALAAGVVPVLLSIHSFTPVWRGTPRLWHAGVLWDRDPRLAYPLLEALAADTSLKIGDNEPYDGALKGDCLWRHGTSRGLPHALLEIRQDLIASKDGQDAWAARLASIITKLLASEAASADLKREIHYGSKAS
jgi:predicted N-formylglutamate amidohydrolase